MAKSFHTRSRNGQRGASLVEFAIAATVFLTVTFAVLEFGRALWVYNALADAARKGARYAVLHDATAIDDVKRMVVYGNTAGTGNPVVDNLSTTNVEVTYPGFGLIRDCHCEHQQLPISICSSTCSVSISMPSPTTTLPANVPANPHGSLSLIRGKEK